MKYFFIILFSLIYSFSFGQIRQKIDSLQSESNNDIDKKTRLSHLTEIFNAYLFIDLDSAKIYKDLINKLPREDKKELINIFSLSSKYYYYSSQLDSSLYYTEKALGIALELNDNNLKSDLYRKLAILSSRNGDYENAEIFGKLALKSAYQTKDWHLIASSNIMLGNQYYKKTKFDLALKYFLIADSLYVNNNKKDRFLANSYDNISSIYTDLKDRKALFYIEKSKNIYHLLKDKEGLAYNNILKGIYYSKMNEHNKAIINYETAMNFYEDYGDVFRLNDVQTRLMNSYSKSGNYDKAEIILMEAKKNLKNSEGQDDFIMFYLNAGQLNIDLNKYDTAIEFLIKAENLINKNEDNFSIGYSKEIKKGLTEAYIGKKDYSNALKYSQLLLQITDSINKKNNIEITKELETQYQTEKKEQEITLLKSQNELAEQQKKSQRNLLLGGLGVTTIAGLFLFVLFRNRQKTNTKLKELDKVKSNFFANISHEFRTPLTLISNPIQEALEDQSLPEKKREQFQTAQRNSDRLLSLINQLLDLSKIDAGQLKLKIRKSNVINLIAALSESFSYPAKQKQINYLVNTKKSEETVWFDKDAIEKIVVNLLSNAIKYSPEKGSIVCNSYLNNGSLTFEVKNTGQGLTTNELNNIFQRFYQTNEDNTGSGIGLALVKELVELHKGSIHVDSVLNEWTTFTVKLPVDKNTFKNEQLVDPQDVKPTYKSTLQQPANDEEVEFIDNEQPILLIVEDNTDVRNLLKQTFEPSYNIITAPDGDKGVKLAIEHIPDIIISDIMMPVKDGIVLTHQLKNDERTTHIPIILLTAKAGDESKFKGVETGADDYITKPFDKKLLILKVKKLIESRRNLQARYSQELILTPKDIAVSNIDEKFLEKVQTVLEDNLVESSFSIEDFSKAVGMSRMQLHRKIKALTGLSASEFIRSQRLKLAAQLLKKSDINISQVGYTVGFNDHSYFTKCFKEAYNCTPTEFAKRSV